MDCQNDRNMVQISRYWLIDISRRHVKGKPHIMVSGYWTDIV